MNDLLNLIPCVMGLPTINENLVSLLQAMADHPANVGLGVIMTWAKVIGLCIALGVGANECFQMMLGRRGIDVMKLIHIVIISMCITFAGSIANMASQPGKALTELAKNQAYQQNDKVKEKEAEVAAEQEKYLEKVREHLQQLEENEKAQRKASDVPVVGGLIDQVEDFQISVKNRIKEFTLLTEMKICEWLNLIIRFLGEVAFQVAYYGIMVCQAIFMHILASFAPLMFAISLSPHFKSAWSQWLSKYISLSLWGFVAYVCVYYVGYIMEWTLTADITAYTTFMNDVDKDTEGDVNIAAIGMQAIGTTCMYVVGLLVGVRAIAFVPEVASWLIPGGVASGAGNTAAGMTMAAGAMAGGAAGAIAGGAIKYGGQEIGTIAKDTGTVASSVNSAMLSAGQTAMDYRNRNELGSKYYVPSGADPK